MKFGVERILTWAVAVNAVVAVGLLALGSIVPKGFAVLAIHVLCLLVTLRVIGLFRERERARRALLVSEQRFRSLIQNAADVIAVLDSERRVKYVSGGFEKLLGFHPDAVMGKRITTLLDPVDLDHLRQALVNAREPGVARPVGRDIRLRRPDGQFRWVSVVITNQIQDPSIGGWVLNVHDVTERKSAEEELARLAMHDSLTGLPNRAHLRHMLSRNVEHHPGRTAILFCDLDGFKAVNDRYGHETGDAVLRAVAARWSFELRMEDVLGRWGGDEFVVVCPMVPNAQEASRVADRLRKAMEQTLKVEGVEVPMGCSIGVAVHEVGEGVEQLLNRADSAMYAAKVQNGRIRLP